MTNSVTSGFDSLSPADFLTQAQRIVAAMTGNPHFPEPWPSQVPPLATIKTDLEAFQEVLAVTLAGDRTRIPQRDSLLNTLSRDLRQLRMYVEMVADGDATLLQTTGFPIRPRGTRSAPELPTAPTHVRMSHGVVSGMLVLRSRRVATAASYEVQVTTGDPMVETNWTEVGIFATCRRIELQGLTPGKVYSARIRGIGVAGSGAWATVPGLMVM